MWWPLPYSNEHCLILWIQARRQCNTCNSLLVITYNGHQERMDMHVDKQTRKQLWREWIKGILSHQNHVICHTHTHVQCSLVPVLLLHDSKAIASIPNSLAVWLSSLMRNGLLIWGEASNGRRRCSIKLTYIYFGIMIEAAHLVSV